MAARLYVTVYAPDDLPTEAAHVASKSLGTVNAWTELTYKHVRHGTGSLKGRISRHHAQAALLQQDRYVIVHSDAGPIGGAFLDGGKIDLSADDGKGDEWMVWEGRGAMSILERGRLLEDWYSTDPAAEPARGQYTNEGVWEWDGTVTADPIYYGGVLSRAVEEGQDQPGNPLAVVSMWGTDGENRRDEDASGTVWTGIADKFRTQIGTSVLELVERFGPFGVVAQMSHLFRLDAYNEANFGTDRAGAFGVGTVRLEKGVNVSASIDRKVRGAVARTHLLVGGADYEYVTVVHPDYVSGPAHWGFLSASETSDPSDLEAIGLAHLLALDRQTDAWMLPLHDHGDDPANGIYEPAPDIADGHFWVGDTISFHTGTGEYDANEQSAPVAAITWQLKTGDEANGDYSVIVEIGSTFYWSAAQAFGGTAPGSQHEVIFCAPGSGGGTGTVYEHFDWDDGEEIIQHPVDPMNDQMLLAASAVGPEPGADGSPSCGTFGNNSAIESNGIAVTAGTTYRVTSKSQGFGDSWPSTPFGQCNWSIGIIWRNSVGAYISEDVIASHTNIQDGPFLADAGGDFTAPTGATAMHFKQAMGVLGTENANTKWDSVTISTVSGAAAGGDHPDLVGTGTHLARCGHRHDVHRDRPPAVSDDDDAGYPVGTIWAQLDDLDNPTEIVGVWVLVDATTGAAIWLPLPLGDSSHTHPPTSVVSTVVSHGSMGAAETFDVSQGTDHEGVQDANLTVTLDGATAGQASWLTLVLTQDGTGGHSLTLPGSVVNAADVEGAWDTTASAVNILTLFTYDGGTTWYGFLAGGSGGASALDDLTDVTITTPATDDTLRYNGSAWVNDNRRWEAVTDGADVFVWEGDDLVHEWSEY